MGLNSLSKAYIEKLNSINPRTLEILKEFEKYMIVQEKCTVPILYKHRVVLIKWFFYIMDNFNNKSVLDINIKEIEIYFNHCAKTEKIDRKAQIEKTINVFYSYLAEVGLHEEGLPVDLLRKKRRLQAKKKKKQAEIRKARKRKQEILDIVHS